VTGVEALKARIEAELGERVIRATALGGGCVAKVSRVELAGGASLVAKQGGDSLALEGWMLGYLAERSSLPLPRVLFTADDLLLLEYVENDGARIGASVQEHAAHLLADLHAVRAPRFGLERDTVIGGLHQPNTPSDSWIAFFAEQRLLAMGRRARDAQALPEGCVGRLERLASRLDRWLLEPPYPSLIHGDVWGGNVLTRADRIAAFIDPAIYHADPEIELAFSTLFSTFGDPFFARYCELRPLEPGFFEARRDLYNLYPLLVHAVLFGRSYGASVDATLRRFVG
jgi:fructosamine-3-kinase